MKAFAEQKETINKTKRQTTQWEKIFANDATNRRLVSKIFKQRIQLNTKHKQPNQKMGSRSIIPQALFAAYIQHPVSSPGPSLLTL